jgi:hypothetical protein
MQHVYSRVNGLWYAVRMPNSMNKAINVQLVIREDRDCTSFAVDPSRQAAQFSIERQQGHSLQPSAVNSK